MYSQGTPAVGRRGVSYTTSGRYRQRRTSQEGVRLIQLAVCLALFLTVFLWNGVFPQRMVQVRNNILALISNDLDFETVLASLGQSLAEGDTVLSELGAFCVEVFGPEQQAEPAEEEVSFTPPGDMLAGEVGFLSQLPPPEARTDHYAQVSRFGLELEKPVESEEPEQEEPPAAAAAGTVLVVSDYDGPELPENYTMDQLSLGDLETMTPVLGHLNSEYGYRDHPIDGEYHFHTGVDIGGKTGDPIAAFADGTVEYTGKDDSYGLYLQVDHGNGVKSFYAHCSEIVVVKGQKVYMGDTLALIGSTGSSTGPHLHLELKYNKTRLNPAYYVEFLDQ